MSVSQRQLTSVLPRGSPCARSLAFPPSICPRVGTAASRHESACSPNASGESAGAPPDGGGLTPVSDTVVDGRRVLVYECAWNTLDTHNFRHRLVTTATFSPGGEIPDGGGTGGVTKTAETQPVVGNLVVTDVETSAGNADYLLFDPESEDPNLKNPWLSFTITDEGDPHQYVWVVYLKPTRVVGWPEEGTCYMWGWETGPGQVTAVWNGPLNFSEGVLERGPVTFDIGVWEVQNASAWGWWDGWLDEAYFRWPYKLTIPVTFEVEGEQVPGHELSAEIGDGTVTVMVNYALTDTGAVDATEVKMDLLDCTLVQKATADGPTEVGVWHADVTVGTMSEEEWVSDWTAVFRGADGHGAETRDHENRRMLAVNVNPPRRPAANFCFGEIWNVWSASGKPGQESAKRERDTVWDVKWRRRTLRDRYEARVSGYGDWKYKAGGKDVRVGMWKRDPDVKTVYQALASNVPVFAYYGHGWARALGRTLWLPTDSGVFVFGSATDLDPAAQAVLAQKPGEKKRFTGDLPNNACSNMLCAVIVACGKSGIETASDAGEEEATWATEHFTPELQRLGARTIVASTAYVRALDIPLWARSFWEFGCWGVGDVQKGNYSASNTEGWHVLDLRNAFTRTEDAWRDDDKDTVPPLQCTGGSGVYARYTVQNTDGSIAPNGHGWIPVLKRTVTQGKYY